MKIAYVLDDTLDSTDGVQQYVLNVGKWMSSRGHDVHYIVGETKRTDIPNVHSMSRNIKVRFNGNALTIPLFATQPKIRRIIDGEKFDVIHVQMPYSPLMAGKVIKSVASSTAVIGTFHIAPNSFVVYCSNIFLRMIIGSSIKRFSNIISVSKTACIFAERTFRIKSEVVPNTIDLSPYTVAIPEDKYSATLNVIYFGRLVERKGCEFFLRAINELHKNNRLTSETKVIVCGKGPLEDKLKSYVKDHDLDKVVLFAGFISEDEKPKLLAAADILAYPSTGGESFGIVLLEGMAASRGVVLAGDNPGYRAVLASHPESLLDPTDTSLFADRIAEYINNPAKRKLESNWQKQFVEQFSIQDVGQRIEAIYKQALHKYNG